MKKLARKFRHSEDENLSLPVHEGDSRPMESQGTIFLVYLRVHKNYFILFHKFELDNLISEDLDFVAQSRKS